MSPRRRACAIGAWSLVVTGVVHAAAVAAGAGETDSPVERLADTHLVIAGLDRSLWQLFTGFSLAMALFIVGLGALNLLVLRRAPELFLDGRAVIVLNLGIVVPALALSVLFFPPPPIVLLGVGGVAFGYALVARSSAAR
ncbi:hypothetical protein BJY16_008701 [Actinoplanes octamycinicus]|uniref:Uncharacterized protein n=1 Tax=Actinoplanes octamycinicus TaxID=135948 RepID=A0A7W7H7I9_9ACTN|nr:hypothetical protein [Actinoplanes octamycinicus]MBB4745242.1 hypothetical protein [Actinoplanes octamycinicus]